MRQTDPKFNLRLPGDLRDRLHEAAEANNRSTNAEIVHRLKSSLAGAPPAGAVPPDAFSASNIMAMLRDIQHALDARPAIAAPAPRPAPLVRGNEPMTPERDAARLAEHFRRWMRSFGTIEPAVSRVDRIDSVLEVTSDGGKQFIVYVLEVPK